MGRRSLWQTDELVSILSFYWNTDLRWEYASSTARTQLRKEGLYDAARLFLRDVIHRSAVATKEWALWFNVGVMSPEDVREDAEDLCEWLFDGEPLPMGGPPRGPIGPPST